MCFFVFNFSSCYDGLVCANLVRNCDYVLLIGQAYDCPSNTSCRPLWNSWSMLFFFQMITLLEFAFKDARPATQVPGSVCTCQTRNTSFFVTPVFYWKFRSLCCSDLLCSRPQSTARHLHPDLCRQSGLTLVSPGHLMKTDDRSVIRTTHSSHLYS